MGRPFSERVAEPGWHREVENWVEEQLAPAGHRVTGPSRQPHLRPWSTQLVLPTDLGLMWFKANCAGLAFEPLLHTELARLAPASVDQPYAIDAARGWALTRDRGATLGDSHQPTAADWRQVLGEAAAVQRLAAGHVEELLRTGLPDCSPGTVVDRLDRLVDILVDLPEQHPSRIDADLERRLRIVRPAIVDAVDELCSSSLPATWQHGDIHPWNVFAVSPDSLRIFDFGDGQWAHAAELLSVPRGWITERSEVPWEDVVESYCAIWGVGPADLESQRRATDLTQPVNRAMTWWVCLTEATAAEWAEWGRAPVDHLSRLVDP
ncbi:phosphotransferase [Aeromicrobium sp.]|uniref:phosphotransferase n=1 Tax=Aeromicrobium sp. TaxID=1871063 RepID=UPI003C55CEDB